MNPEQNIKPAQIWVDADACPVVIKNILFKAASRTGVSLTLVANHQIAIPKLQHIHFLRVLPGFDVADHEIVQRLQAKDLVITADIPLAADVVAKGGLALNPRGEWYTQSTIKARLSMRNFMDELRSSGVQTGGPAVLDQKNRQTFSNHLDQWLQRNIK